MEILLGILRFVGVMFLVLLIFNLMIVVHEWGHFLAGRWRGLVIDRFQIWFGKPIWKKTVNGVQYGLGTIPAGGFVSLPQMAPMESIEGKVEDAEKEKLPPISPLDKIIVAFAGPLFSFLLAVVFACAVWLVKKPVEEFSSTTVIGGVAETMTINGEEMEGPAHKAGLRPGDQITFINGHEVKQFLGMNDSVKWHIMSAESDDIEVDVLRDGKEMTFMVHAPHPEPEEIEGNVLKQWLHSLSSRKQLRSIGIGPARTALIQGVMENGPTAGLDVKKGDIVVAINGKPVSKQFEVVDFLKSSDGQPAVYTLQRGARNPTTHEVTLTPRLPDVPENYEEPLDGILYSYTGMRELKRINPLVQVKDACRTIFNTLQKVFNPKSGIGPSQLSGPIGIMGLYYDLFQHPDGWRLVLWFSVILNVNLAILNMMPFPVLDGGHIVMATMEAIRRRPPNLKVLEVVQTAFVLLLLGFMVFVSFKDVGDRVPDGDEEAVEAPVAPRFNPPGS